MRAVDGGFPLVKCLRLSNSSARKTSDRVSPSVGHPQRFVKISTGSYPSSGWLSASRSCTVGIRSRILHAFVRIRKTLHIALLLECLLRQRCVQAEQAERTSPRALLGCSDVPSAYKAWALELYDHRSDAYLDYQNGVCRAPRTGVCLDCRSDVYLAPRNDAYLDYHSDAYPDYHSDVHPDRACVQRRHARTVFCTVSCTVLRDSSVVSSMFEFHPRLHGESCLAHRRLLNCGKWWAIRKIHRAWVETKAQETE